MPLNLPTFYTRTLSAIVFVIIMLTGMLWNEWSFTLLVLLIQFLCLREYFGLMKKITPDVRWHDWQPLMVQVAGLFIIAYNIPEVQNIFRRYDMVRISFFAVSAITPAIALLLSILLKQESIIALLQAIGGLFYITLPMLLLFFLAHIHPLVPLSLVIMIWINDTMAYIVGSLIGKTPMSAISPRKTWEGTIGGAALTVGVAVALELYSHYQHELFFPYVHWVVLALCAGIAGTFGDLLESKLKRLAGVKDSGNIMPGHGGALDRFDSLLIATPFAFACYVCMGV